MKAERRVLAAGIHAQRDASWCVILFSKAHQAVRGFRERVNERICTVIGYFENQAKKIDLSWIFGLKFLDHFTIDTIVMSSYFQKVSRIKLRMRKKR